MRDMDKNIDKMSAGELRRHCKELRVDRSRLMSELRVALAVERKPRSCWRAWLCVAVACSFIIVGAWYWYYK